MKWAAVIEYIQDPDLVQAHRPMHRAYLSSLLEAKKLFCAGPFMDDFGALIVYDTETKEEAEALIQADPFHAGKIFVRWDLRPWKVVFVTPELFPPVS